MSSFENPSHLRIYVIADAMAKGLDNDDGDHNNGGNYEE